MSFRTDNIPLVGRPFYLAFSFFVAAMLYGLCAAINICCKIEYEGTENTDNNQNYIFCIWHHTLAAYFTVFIRHNGNHIWMNHPSWVMKPIHFWLRLSGVNELALGSAGNSGKEALQKVILFLKKGYNTLITPDGPAGPPHSMKPGVLQMSMETGVPIIPMKIIPSHFFTIPTWDKKRIPLPFSTIRVVYGKPVVVTKDNYEEVKRILESELEEKPIPL